MQPMPQVQYGVPPQGYPMSGPPMYGQAYGRGGYPPQGQQYGGQPGMCQSSPAKKGSRHAWKGLGGR